MALRKAVSLFDAVLINMGAIVGAGIYVILGIAVGMAGPAVVVSVTAAGLIALLTARSYAVLSRRITAEGGIYEYARELVSPSFGFATGFLWIVSNVVAGAAVALGFGGYFSALTGVGSVPVAFAVSLLFTYLNYRGMKKSVRANNALVVSKVAILAFFVLVCLPLFRLPDFSGMNATGVLQATALIFFAYGGFARVTIISEEVVEPAKNVPKAVMYSLLLSTVIYVAVSLSATGVQDYGAARPEAFLSFIAGKTGFPFAGLLMSIGALIATSSVLLTGVLGVSRVMFAMSRNADLPKALSVLEGRNRTPKRAVLVAGLASSLLTLIGNLWFVASLSSFAMLVYYAAANVCAVRTGHARTSAVLGFVSCIVLTAFLSPESVIAGSVVLAAGLACFLLGKRKHD